MQATDNFEFRRRIDTVVYRFDPAMPARGAPWKRVDLDLWLTYVSNKGWCIVDSSNVIKGRPWVVELAEQSAQPPEGEQLSKNDDKSYVYDLGPRVPAIAGEDLRTDALVEIIEKS